VSHKPLAEALEILLLLSDSVLQLLRPLLLLLLYRVPAVLSAALYISLFPGFAGLGREGTGEGAPKRGWRIV
jgi:hypothetical protein